MNFAIGNEEGFKKFINGIDDNNEKIKYYAVLEKSYINEKDEIANYNTEYKIMHYSISTTLIRIQNKIIETTITLMVGETIDGKKKYYKIKNGSQFSAEVFPYVSELSGKTNYLSGQDGGYKLSLTKKIGSKKHFKIGKTKKAKKHRRHRSSPATKKFSSKKSRKTKKASHRRRSRK